MREASKLGNDFQVALGMVGGAVVSSSCRQELETKPLVFDVL